MPRLFNAENMLFQTFAVASIASQGTATATFTGVTTDDYVFVLQNNDLAGTSIGGVAACISAANTIVFQPATVGGTSVAQTVGVGVMVSPTSGVEGGSW